MSLLHFQGWDLQDNHKTTLTESQKDSIYELNKLSGLKLYPKDFSVDEENNEGNLNFSDSSSQLSSYSEFLQWYNKIEERCVDKSTANSQKLISDLEKQHTHCTGLLNEICGALTALSQLRVQYTDVATKTNALHDACEHLLDEQAKLVKRADALDESLAYFNVIEPISAKLSSPALQVLPETFYTILNQIDESLRYLQSHPDFADSAMYIARFRHSLGRALFLIQQAMAAAVDNAIEAVAIGPQLMNGTKGDVGCVSVNDNAFSLFYGRFCGHAAKVRPLSLLIEERVAHGSSEYAEVLLECRLHYLKRRETLLKPSVEAAISDLVATHPRDHCTFLRAGCALMSRLCDDEMNLYSQFFGTDVATKSLLPSVNQNGPHLTKASTPVTSEMPLQQHELNEMTRRLCSCFYDAFRPMVVHMQHLETLSELCSILQMEIQSNGSIEESANAPISPTALSFGSSEHTGFGWLCRVLLADLQERLVYRTHVYMRTEILGFTPVSGDLAYPEKLQMMREIAEGLQRGEISNQRVSSSSDTSNVFFDDSIASNMPLSPADLHGMWYPTVRRTLVCLSKLSRCLDRAAFQGLSQECLGHCVASLCSAANRIVASRQALDGQLFLIKHLLILREQVAPFNIEFSITETSLDFKRLKDAAFGLLAAKGRLLALNKTNALLQFLLEGTPDVVESINDSRLLVDLELKRACEELIADSSALLCGKLLDFIKKAQAIATMNESLSSHASKVSLRDQPFSSPEKLHELVTSAYRDLKQNGLRLLDNLRLYLANPDTEQIIFRPIRNNVVQAFGDITRLIGENFSEEDRTIVACPSADQVNLLLQFLRN